MHFLASDDKILKPNLPIGESQLSLFPKVMQNFTQIHLPANKYINVLKIHVVIVIGMICWLMVKNRTTFVESVMRTNC